MGELWPVRVEDKPPDTQDNGEALAPSRQKQSIIRNPATGQFEPGTVANPYGRPRKGESYAEIAAALASRTKRTVVASMVKRAAKGDVRAAEFLRDTAEGKPATRVVVESSSDLAELVAGFTLRRQAIEAEYELRELDGPHS